MKTTNFMLGNYVCVNPSNMIIRIDAIHQKKVGYHACNSRLAWVRHDLIKPIPLTEQLLINNGFYYDEEHDWYIFDGLAISKDDDVFLLGTISVGFLGDEFHYIAEIHNFHELQNFVYLYGITKTLTPITYD